MPAYMKFMSTITKECGYNWLANFVNDIPTYDYILIVMLGVSNKNIYNFNSITLSKDIIYKRLKIEVL